MALAPAAHADSDQDAAFIAALSDHGLTIRDGGYAGALRAAHTVCDLLASGYTMNAVVAMEELHRGTDLTDDDVNLLTHVSAAAYCPAYIR